MGRLTVEYKDTHLQATKQKALADCEAYLGQDNYARITTLLRNDKTTSPTMAVQMLGMFVGLEGYPAEVMVEKFLGKAS